jgi:ATP-binding protein involved in chromosome partitioning
MNNVFDPREYVISDRLAKIKKIILVSGFKGGVGKSLVSVFAAIAIARKGYKTGLLDLDITSSTDDIILGVKEIYPSEDKGLIPPVFEGIRFMSFSFFSMSKPIALRGNSVVDAIKELLCVTLWGELDFLVVDMPPGFGDTFFEVMRLFKKFRVVCVYTPSPLSKKILNKILPLIKTKGIEVVKIENMSKISGKGRLRYDKNVDAAIGDIKRIRNLLLYKDVVSNLNLIVGQKI